MTVFSERIDLHDSRWMAAFNQLDDVQYWRDSAWTNQGTPNLAIQALCYAFDDTILTIKMMIGRTGYVVPEATMIGNTFKNCWEYEFDEMPSGVTYQAICEAWGKDDFEGRVATIAFIDRMRQLIWNEPYQVMWAAKPEEQEFPE